MEKIISGVISLVTVLIFGAVPAFAHVVVKPAQVGVAAFQTFTMGVPNEKDNPTTAVRLVIPDGLKSVFPNVKPGWKIDVKKDGIGDSVKVTEISWMGGSIPAGQRDDFYFSAQVPATESTLNWKAYQTYSNGEVVSWDQDPSKAKGPDDDSMTPYSKTKVVNDLTAVTQSNTSPPAVMDTRSGKMAVVLSGLAVILSMTSLVMHFRKR